MTPAVRLVEVTRDTVDEVLALAVAPAQAGFVAPNAHSIAEAHFEPGAWFRPIEAEDVGEGGGGWRPVGFAMIHDPTLPGAAPEPSFDAETVLLWRFMIDRRFQGRGLGRAAIALLVAHVRTRPGIRRFVTTYGEGPGGPAPFYARLGFAPTGRIVEGEAEAVMAL